PVAGIRPLGAGVADDLDAIAIRAGLEREVDQVPASAVLAGGERMGADGREAKRDGVARAGEEGVLVDDGITPAVPLHGPARDRRARADLHRVGPLAIAAEIGRFPGLGI